MNSQTFFAVSFATWLMIGDASAGFSQKLSVDESKKGEGEIYVKYTLTNTGKEAVDVLKWGTPLEGLRSEALAVQRDGREVPYEGLLSKRGQPSVQSFIRVEAGASVSKTVPLSPSFDLTSAGHYKVITRIAITGGAPGEPGKASKLKPAEQPKQASANFTIKATDKISAPLSRKKQVSAQAYTGCAAGQTSQVEAATKAAGEMATKAKANLSASSASAPSKEYVTWFGVSNSSRYGTVVAHFSAISSTIDGKRLSFNCTPSDCEPDEYAHVFATDPNKMVYLCSAFWSAANVGTNSRAGTVVHETSHFKDVSGTTDKVNGVYVYGQAMCMDLAKRAPDSAITVADCHEYFAEGL